MSSLVRAEPLLLRLQPPRPPGAPASSSAEYSAYVGVSIDAAVNLLDAREFTHMSGAERLRTALAEQRGFLSRLLGFDTVAFDLRIRIDPGRPLPMSVHVLARTWSRDAEVAMTTAIDVRRHLLASVPPHVNATAISEPAQVGLLLNPYPDEPLETAVITKREVSGFPSRRDAQVDEYFSVRPFTMAEVDWTSLYRLLVASPVPLTVSAALFPFRSPPGFSQQLAAMATFYARLAREDETSAGLYYGRRKIPPDAFAVEAELVFQDYLRRCGERAFLFRLQVSAPRLPAGVVQALGGAVSPSEMSDGRSAPTRERMAATFDVRTMTDATSRVGRYNLASIDCYPAVGGLDVLRRLGDQAGYLPLLSTVGDASDALCMFRLPIAVDGVVPGFPVRRGQFGHSEAYATETVGLAIGRVVNGAHSVRIPLDALTKHCLIAGSTGSGKTTTVLELLRQLWVEHSIPFLVVEPVNSDADDYRRLLGVPGLDAMRVLTVGDERVAPLRFNPFQVPDGVLVSEHLANLLACFKAAFGLWEPLPLIYREALDVLYAERGIASSEVGGPGRPWPTAIEFEKVMRQVVKNPGYAGELKANIEAASVVRIQQLCRGVAASSFLTDQPLDTGALLAAPTLIELRALGGGDEQSLMMALLLNAMTEHYKVHRPPGGGLQHVTVIEEAHRLLARPHGGSDTGQAQAKERAAAEFANVLAENRKYGEGIVIAEQIPTKLVEDAVKNTNLKVMHRMTADEDRRYLGESMGMDEVQLRFGTRLRTGEALVYADEFAEAVHVQVEPQIGSDFPSVEVVAAPPFEGCAPCRVQCRYRGPALAALADPTLRSELARTRRAVGEVGLTPEALQERWTDLTDTLRRQVERFPVFPTTDPDQADAAFCLFLHARARETMAPSARWPAAVARQLRILPVPGDGS